MAVSRRLLLIAGAALACDGSTGPSGPPRTFRMGFSAIPPRFDQAVLLQSLNLWTSSHADAAIMHISVPWAALLSGIPAPQEVAGNELGLANFYRGKQLMLVVMIDVTNGLDRSAEDPTLDSAGRSITDTAIQRMYREYVVAFDSIVHPDYLGLAAETNLIRLAAPDSVYQAVVAMTNAAAASINARSGAPPLFVSVQVEVVWGRLVGGSYAGIAQDLSDFPFVEAIGLSSYPYLGGFALPESIPLDYYARVLAGTGLPSLVVEGGWTSVSLGAFVSSPATQARYLIRQAQLLDSAHAIGLFQLTFADLDLSAFPGPPGSLTPFAHLGVVDSALGRKPALASWDSILARSFVP
ncbi:MAG TPA: hypothetical protein VJ816_12080 [Gemmatimonadales bacterium]|nr:hypothetical protein [Gemmatimonadales bacterium]